MATASKLRALLAAATPGPWYTSDNYDVGEFAGYVYAPNATVATDATDTDAALIVAAINALPRLLDVVEAAEDAVDARCSCAACDEAQPFMVHLRDALDALEGGES